MIKVFEKWKRLLTGEWVWDIVKLMGSLFGAEIERAVIVAWVCYESVEVGFLG